MVVTSHTCYNDTGIKYRGTTGISERGNLCETWPQDMVQNVGFKTVFKKSVYNKFINCN